jgi:hypothetical protein
MRVTRSSLAVAFAVLVLVPGCFEERIAVSLHASRAGKIHVSKRSGEALALLQMLGAKSEDEKRARARSVLVDELACWDGVAAWTNERAALAGDRVEIQADAYFEDVNAVARIEPGVGDQRFKATAIDGSFELAWTLEPAKVWTAGTLERSKACAKALDGLEIVGEIQMPGPVTHGEGATREIEAHPSWMLVSAKELSNEIADYEKRVAAGDLSEPGAAKALQTNYAARTARVTCRVTEPSSALGAFESELRAAEESYGAGELKKEIEERRAERPRPPVREASVREASTAGD